MASLHSPRAAALRQAEDRSGCLRSLTTSPVHLWGMDTDHTAESPWGLEPLLDAGELAAYLGVPLSTVYDWRTRGLGPRAYRFGKHLKFAVSDVRAWIEQQREPGPASAGR